MLRTVQLIGGAYSLDGNLSAVIKFNNNVVYDGALANIARTAVPESGFSTTDVLASWDYDFGFVYGQVSPGDANVDFSIKISGGDSFSGITFAGVKTNWFIAPAQIDIINKEWFSPGAEVFKYPCLFNLQTDGKNNVSIDGVNLMWQRSNDKIGIYHWPIYSGSTLLCQLDVRATITPDNSYTLSTATDEEVILRPNFDITEALTFVKEYQDECRAAGRCLAIDKGRSDTCPSIDKCSYAFMHI